jgi:hypothetical protein
MSSQIGYSALALLHISFIAPIHECFKRPRWGSRVQQGRPDLFEDAATLLDTSFAVHVTPSYA